MSYISNIQINSYETSLSSDELFNFVSRIDWTYDMSDSSGNTKTEVVVLTFNEQNGYIYDLNTTITNQNLINFVSQPNVSQTTRNKLVSGLNKIANPRTYRWYIYEMMVIPNFEGYENFVSNISWRYNCISDMGYEANLLGQTTYNTIEDHPYISYYNLTETDVNTWLDEQPNLSDLQYNLDRQIDELMNPPVITLPTPW